MGSICSKGSHQEDDNARQDKSSIESSRQHVASSGNDKIVAADAGNLDGNGTTMVTRKSQEQVLTRLQISVDDGKSKAQVSAASNLPLPNNMIAHHGRTTVDIGAGEAEFVVKINHIPNAHEAELVAVGWPSWLASVAGEAIKGWVPRRADRFEKLDKIGQGTYSNVYKARDIESGKIVALKKVRFVNLDPESVRFMAREIHILRKLDHTNIVKLEGLITSKMSSSLYLVFEYMEHDLTGLAATPGIKFTEPQVKCYMQQLLNGLDHCHNRGILHRDIKGSNLLIGNNGILKIGDFGLATNFCPDLNQPLTSRVVTLWYRPPELLLGATEYGVAVDLWSSGCILAELLAGKPIMPGRTEVEQMHKIFKLCGSPSEDFWRRTKLPHATIFKPQHPYRRCVRETFKDFPSPALDLLDVLLAIKPVERGTASSALNSGFFTTKPYPCDPSSLPTYPPSKEFDAKLRDEKARRQRAAATNNLGSEYTRNTSRRTGKTVDGATRPSLQKTNTQLNTRRVNDKQECGRSQFANYHNGRTRTHISHSGPFLNHGALAPSFTLKVKDIGVKATASRSSTLRGYNGPEFRTQRSFMPHNGAGDPNNPMGLVAEKTIAPSANHGERSKHRTHWPENRLDVAEATEMQEWTNQIFDIHSSSHRKDERRIGAKETTMGYGGKKNRIHYSGPLMPPGGNMEDMLREHERQIQQAVRKARLDKAKTRKIHTDQRQV